MCLFSDNLVCIVGMGVNHINYVNFPYIVHNVCYMYVCLLCVLIGPVRGDKL